MYKRTERVYKEISKSEARSLIYEARYFPAVNGSNVVSDKYHPEEVCAYERVDGMLHRLFSIRNDLPHGIKDWDEDVLLIYVRSRIPEELTFS